MTAKVQQPLDLSVEIGGNPSKSITINRYKDNVLENTSTTAFTNIINTSLYASTSGTYRIDITDGTTTVSAQTAITVNPQITVSLPPTIEVTEGQPLELTATLGNNDKANDYQWKFNGTKFNSGVDVPAGTNTLYVKVTDSATQANAGEYEVIVGGSNYYYYEASAKTTVTVKAPVVLTIEGPKTDTINVGEALTIPFALTGTTEPTSRRIYKDDVLIKEDTSTVSAYTITDSATLEDAGIYKIDASADNFKTQVSFTVNIHVVDPNAKPLAFDPVPQSRYEVDPYGSIKLAVGVVGGISPLNYTVTENGSPFVEDLVRDVNGKPVDNLTNDRGVIPINVRSVTSDNTYVIEVTDAANTVIQTTIVVGTKKSSTPPLANFELDGPPSPINVIEGTPIILEISANTGKRFQTNIYHNDALLVRSAVGTSIDTGDPNIQTIQYTITTYAIQGDGGKYRIECSTDGFTTVASREWDVILQKKT